MELKTYQLRTLDAFSRWLEALEAAQNESEAAIEAWPEAAGEIPDVVRNYPLKAWEALRVEDGVAATAGEYVNRTDDADRPIPHICFKVPTGGGKTLLAAAALERRHQQTGLILWIVPSKAIYNQTKGRPCGIGNTRIVKCWSGRVRGASKCWKRMSRSTETMLPTICVLCCCRCRRLTDTITKIFCVCLRMRGVIRAFFRMAMISSVTAA